MDMFGWVGMIVHMEALRGLTKEEVRPMLKDVGKGGVEKVGARVP